MEKNKLILGLSIGRDKKYISQLENSISWSLIEKNTSKSVVSDKIPFKNKKGIEIFENYNYQNSI